MTRKHPIGLIGYGRMGAHWADKLAASPRWDLRLICDVDPARLKEAAQRFPEIAVTTDPHAVIANSDLEAVGLVTLADARPGQLGAALKAGKHVVAEKPLAGDVAEEWQLLEDIERSDRIVAVNLFNRNAWSHEHARAFIASGQIGKLGLIRVGHLTAGGLPGTEHEAEGAPFHNCGMHYIDVLRWYAGSEFAQWHAQGLRMWDEPEPWWVTAHGTFENGIAFEISVGFVYGQAAKDRRNNSYCELIGTHGVISIDHDFHTARCRCNGTSQTQEVSKFYGDKNLDVLFERAADSLDAGRLVQLPTPRDSIIASSISQKMLDEASAGPCPSIGTREQLQDLVCLRGWQHRLREPWATPGNMS